MVGRLDVAAQAVGLSAVVVGGGAAGGIEAGEGVGQIGGSEAGFEIGIVNVDDGRGVVATDVGLVR